MASTSRWLAGRIGWMAGSAIGLMLLLTACGGGSDESTDDIADEATETTAEASPASSTTTSTTIAPTTETTLSAAEEEEALVERLMEANHDYWRAYLDCLADVAACDVERDLGDLIGGELRSGVVAVVDDLQASGINDRGLADEHVYRRHGVLDEDPPIYALEVCFMTGGDEQFRINADGSEEIVEAAGERTPELQQIVIEERADGTMFVTRSLLNETDQVEGGNCDEFEE